jgi:hypothetical protein
MMFRIQNFVFDEKDVFIVLFFVFLVIAFVLKIPLEPFRFSSLMVTVVYLLTTRIILGQINVSMYLFVTFIGLLLSMILSPYGLAIFYAVGLFLYTRRNV